MTFFFSYFHKPIGCHVKTILQILPAWLKKARSVQILPKENAASNAAAFANRLHRTGSLRGLTAIPQKPQLFCPVVVRPQKPAKNDQ